MEIVSARDIDTIDFDVTDVPALGISFVYSVVFKVVLQLITVFTFGLHGFAIL